MCHVVVVYSDGSFREFYNINKIEFYENSEYKTLEGSDLLTYRYRLDNYTYHLFSDNGAFSVSISHVKSFEVTLEN